MALLCTVCGTLTASPDICHRCYSRLIGEPAATPEGLDENNRCFVCDQPLPVGYTDTMCRDCWGEEDDG